MLEGRCHPIRLLSWRLQIVNQYSLWRHHSPAALGFSLFVSTIRSDRLAVRCRGFSSISHLVTNRLLETSPDNWSYMYVNSCNIQWIPAMDLPLTRWPSIRTWISIDRSLAPVYRIDHWYLDYRCLVCWFSRWNRSSSSPGLRVCLPIAERFAVTMSISMLIGDCPLSIASILVLAHLSLSDIYRIHVRVMNLLWMAKIWSNISFSLRNRLSWSFFSLLNSSNDWFLFETIWYCFDSSSKIFLCKWSIWFNSSETFLSARTTASSREFLSEFNSLFIFAISAS